MAEKEQKKRKGKNGGLINVGGVQPGAGRPKKLVGQMIEQLKAHGVERVTNYNIVEAFELLVNLTENELKAITLDADAPMIMRIVAKNMLGGKGFEIIEKMLDRAHGKPRLGVDHSAQGLPLAIKFELVPDKNYET